MSRPVMRPIDPVTLIEANRDYGLSPNETMALVCSRAVRGQLLQGRFVVERSSLEAWLRRPDRQALHA